MERSKRAAVYARISKDADGDERGVERQRQDCIAEVERRGWSMVEVVVDNDVSASRYSRKQRPGWFRLLELIDTGAVDALVTYNLDRLSRRPRELEELIDRAERGLVIVTLAGDLDLSTSDGVCNARVLMAFAAKESDNISRRVKRSKLALAQEGRHFAGVKAFGWSGPYEQTPEEANAIRDAAARVLSGESLSSVARSWNEKGWRRPRGGSAWNATTIRDVLSSPRNAGLVQHQGAVIGEARWEPVLDRATYEALRQLFSDPARRTGPRRRGTFTGVFRCGRCGSKLQHDSTSGRRIWRCKPGAGKEACGRLSVTGEPVEAAVLQAMFAAIDQGQLELDRPQESDATALRDVREIEVRLAELAEMYADELVGKAEWLRARDRLRRRLSEALAAIRSTRGGWAIDDALRQPGALEKAWGALPPGVQNTILLGVFEAIVVHPASDGHETPADRLDPLWAR